MKFGAHISMAVGSNPAGDDYVRIAQHAEALGFGSLWVGDHVVIPKKITSPYPYTKDGSIGFPPNTPFLDPFVVLAAVGASTKTLLLGTGILVLPYRNPLIVAKSVVTADLMTNGRLLFGVGLGWLREEFDALGIPFNERGARTDESLRIMKALWSGGDTTFKGRFFSIPDVHAGPPPVQKPHPPIIVGGRDLPAFKRIVAFGDGWYGGPLPAAEMRAQLAQLGRMMSERGRKMSELRITMSCSPTEAVNGKEVAALEEAGVTELLVLLHSPNADACRRELDGVAKIALA